MISLIQNIISRFIALAQELFEYIFSGVQFDVLWSWLPSDIQTAAASFIIVLFAIAVISGIRKFLPF